MQKSIFLILNHCKHEKVFWQTDQCELFTPLSFTSTLFDAVVVFLTPEQTEVRNGGEKNIPDFKAVEVKVAAVYHSNLASRINPVYQSLNQHLKNLNRQKYDR